MAGSDLTFLITVVMPHLTLPRLHPLPQPSSQPSPQPSTKTELSVEGLKDKWRKVYEVQKPAGQSWENGKAF